MEQSLNWELDLSNGVLADANWYSWQNCCIWNRGSAKTPQFLMGKFSLESKSNEFCPYGGSILLVQFFLNWVFTFYELQPIYSNIHSEVRAVVYNGTIWNWNRRLADIWRRCLLGRKQKLITTVEILTAFSNKLVEAEILDDITKVNIAHWKILWSPVVKALIADPNNKVDVGVFDWPRVVSDFGGPADSKIYSLTCNDSTEGMMAISFMEESKPE